MQNLNGMKGKRGKSPKKEAPANTRGNVPRNDQTQRERGSRGRSESRGGGRGGLGGVVVNDVEGELFRSGCVLLGLSWNVGAETGRQKGAFVRSETFRISEPKKKDFLAFLWRAGSQVWPHKKKRGIYFWAEGAGSAALLQQKERGNIDVKKILSGCLSRK